MRSPISDSQTDSSILSHIVGNILVERPHLRPEDQQVLKFLAEKERGRPLKARSEASFSYPGLRYGGWSRDWSTKSSSRYERQEVRT